MTRTKTKQLVDALQQMVADILSKAQVEKNEGPSRERQRPKWRRMKVQVEKDKGPSGEGRKAQVEKDERPKWRRMKAQVEKDESPETEALPRILIFAKGPCQICSIFFISNYFHYNFWPKLF